MKHKLVVLSLLASLLVSCNENNSESIEGKIDSNLSNIYAISYENINSVDDVDAYAAEVINNADNNDDPIDNGIINCPYYTLKVNNIDVPVYSTRTGSSMVHSFAWIDVDLNSNDEYLINVELQVKNFHKNVIVLPESSNISATLENSVVTATINKLGDFTFVFDKGPEEAFTLNIKKNEEFKAIDGYEIKEYNPGTYKIADTKFKEQNTIYYFTKGRYTLSSIYLPSNSILYFERGTYIDVVSETENDYTAGIMTSGTKNVTICGRALLDFSSNQGGPAGHKGKGMFSFSDVDTISFSGITSINSVGWTLCFTNCNDVETYDNMLFGYRTCSDGIMLADCQDSLVHNNFVRTGDDAIETKSTGSEYTENLIYEYNTVWADKARCYGCIYESNNNVNNVIYRHNSIGFALSSWNDNLCCLCMSMGTRQSCVWENVHFEDIEIYKTYNAVMSIVLADPSGVGDGGTCKNIYFENIRVYRAYSYALFIKVQTGSTLGKVYIDNVTFNDTKFTAESIDDKDVSSITHYSTSWSKKLNIKVNTLTEEE